MKIKVLAKSHHRNGVSGDPFNVYLFEDQDDSIKLAVDFGKAAFAVLQVDLLAQGNIAFGHNSWRGDHYAEPVRKAAEKVKQSVAEDAFFINYEVPT